MVQKYEEVSSVIETVLMVLEVIVCIALIGAVLLQSGKGGGMAVLSAAVTVLFLARAMIWIHSWRRLRFI